LRLLLSALTRQWRNWSTRGSQAPVGASPWRFESSLPHSPMGHDVHRKGVVAEVLALRSEGLGARRIARSTGLPRSTVRDWLAGKLPRHSRDNTSRSVPMCKTCGCDEHRFDQLPQHTSTSWVSISGTAASRRIREASTDCGSSWTPGTRGSSSRRPRRCERSASAAWQSKSVRIRTASRSIRIGSSGRAICRSMELGQSTSARSLSRIGSSTSSTGGRNSFSRGSFIRTGTGT
jgi:hypothetical protein